MIDLQYSINLKSNIPGFEILFNGESKGIVKASAKTIPLSLNQIQSDFGGRVDIRLQKTNYVSTIRYELAVTRNPAFQTNSNLGLSGEDMDVYSNVPEFVLFVI
jgi:hypothetical protein